MPTETDNVHVFVEVCAASGLLPNEYCPDRVIKQLIKLPYTVPSIVQDYAQRVPEETCAIHGAGKGLAPPDEIHDGIQVFRPQPSNTKKPPGILPRTQKNMLLRKARISWKPLQHQCRIVFC